MDIRKNVAEIYPMTPLQQGLLFHTETESDGAYVVQTAYELRGQLNEALFKKAWELTIARHPVLRSFFGGVTTDKPVQVILKKAKLSWSVYDWKKFSPEANEVRFNELTEAERKTGFAIDRPPLMRFYWLEIEPNVVRFIWTYHHALLDGWSVPLVLRDVIKCYDSLNKGLQPQLPAPAEYRNYISWLKNQNQQDAINYWSTFLDDFTQPTHLGLNNPSKMTCDSGKPIDELEFSFDEVNTSLFKKFCQQHRITLNLLCQAGLAILMERYSNTTDVVFGTTVSGRPADISNINQLIGAFINTVPVKANIDSGKHVISLLNELRDQQLERDLFSFLPLREIQRLSHSKSGLPLFNTLFVFENFPVDPNIKQSIANLEINRVLLEDKTSFPLTIAAKVTDVLSFNIQFKTSDYHLKDIQHLAANYQFILEQIVNNHQSEICKLETLQPTQQKELLGIGQGIKNDYIFDSTIDRFGTIVNSHPHKVAIIENNEKLTYLELDHRANQLANWLQKQAIDKNQRIAICLPSGIRFVVSMLAILKIEASYLPIEINQPNQRILELMSNAKIAFAITDESINWDKSFNWSSPENTLDQESIYRHKTNVSPESIAYLMYTSGTTGVAKAITIKHKSLANHINDAINRYSINADDRILQFSSLGFDISVEEIWGSLCSGAELVIYDRNDLALNTFEDAINDQKITVVDLPTAYWHTWVGSKLNVDKLTSLKKIIVGGEAARPQTLREWREKLPNVQWFNTYGPTETTVVATVWQVPENGNIPNIIPIGKPIQNVTCLVLDDQQRLTPPGVTGELYIGGIGLTAGYFCRPDLDANSFYYKSFDGTESRFYRTGDRVHWDHDDQLIFHGRRDNQVKLRGYRIELSAIENEISQCQGVKQAHVVTVKSESHTILNAYVAVDLSSGISSQQILHELQQSLPGYMLPSSIVLLDKLPLTPNGKVDSKSLKDIELPNSDTTNSPPVTSLQKQLASYWEQVLGNKIKSIHSNFFELGGDSIHAIKITSLAKQDGLSLEIKQLFESPTISQLAELIKINPPTSAQKKYVVGEQPLSIWQDWLIKQKLLEPNTPQLICLKLFRVLTESEVRTNMKSMIQDNECFRSEIKYDAEKLVQQVNPWSDLISYREVDSPNSFTNQDFKDKLKSISKEISEKTGTHVIQIKGNKISPPLLLLLVYGSRIDEHSQKLLQHQFNANIDDRNVGNIQYTDAVIMQKKLRKTANSDHFESDINFWLDQQQKAVLFDNDQLNKNTSQAVASLDREFINKLSQQYYCSEEELLMYLVNRTVCKHFALETSPGYVLRSARNDSIWKGNTNHLIGDFRTLYPCPIEVNDQESIPLSMKSFKQQFRNNTANSLGYIVNQIRNKIPTPNLSKALLICLSDLDQSEHSFNELEQNWNGIGDKQTGGKVRFVKTEHEIKIIWQMNNCQINLSSVKELADLTKKQAKIIGVSSSNKELISLIPSDFKNCPLDEKSMQSLSKELNANNNALSIDAIYPVTPLQRGMLFHSMAHEDGAYLVQSIYQVKGTLDREKLRMAWQKVMDRHPVLRSFFWGVESKTPAQVVLNQVSLNWHDENWVGINNSEFKRRLESLAKAERNTGFGNNQSPMMRMYCIENEKDCFQFIWTYHHALLDGWSVPLVLQDVLEQYVALVENRKPYCSEVPDYQEYAQWLQNKSPASAKKYWTKELAGITAPNDFRLPQSRAKTSTSEALTSIDFDNWQRLNQFCQLHQITPNVVCQAAWALLINQYSSDSDVIFGTTVSGRSTEINGVNDLVGAFINTVPVRVNLKGFDSTMQVIKGIQQQQLEREEYCYLPLWEIQHLSEIDAGKSLFDSLVVYENYPIDQNIKQNAGNITIEPISGHGDSNYPLTVVMIPGQTLEVKLRYKDISREIAQDLVNNFKEILNQICHSNKNLSDIQTTLPEQNETISILQGPSEIKTHKTVPELFSEVAAKNGDKTAIVEGETTISYTELDIRANTLAQFLQTSGVNKDDTVALRLPRGINAIVGIVAIQKLGAIYLPLDLSAPVSRLEHMLSVCDCRFLLSDFQHNPEMSFSGKRILLDADEVKKELLSQVKSFKLPDIDLEHSAYINFTSGTQGKPKGVVIPQKAIPRLVYDPDYVTLNNSTVMLHASALAFDAATFEIWGALLNGGCLIAYNNEQMDLTKLNLLIQKNNINTMWLTAGLFQQWVGTLNTAVIPELDFVLTGGDVVSPKAVRTLYNKFSHTQVINGYGPTETTTFACCYAIPRDHNWQQAIPIGNPINLTHVKIVDESLRPLPQGNVGELLIGGHGVAKGYIGAKQLTLDKFIELDGQTYFRTGDKVRMNHGEIEFIGRIDRQVKIRGFRIELNEVEAVISQILNNECAVVTQGISSGSKKLYAFIEGKSENFNESQVLAHIKQHLPDYMVPARIVFLDQLPLTDNGKIDLKALPQIQNTSNTEDHLSENHKNTTEQDQISIKVKNLWSNLLALNVNQISDESHFFESGGDSIVAIQLVAKAAEIGLTLTVQQIFNNPVLADMVSVTTPAKDVQRLDTKHHGNISLAPIQHWFFEHFHDYPNHWNQSVLLTVPKDLNIKKMGEAIHSLSQHHDLLRARFTQQNGIWQQFITPWDPLYEIKEVTLVDNHDNWQQQLELISTSQQKSLDINNGELMNLVHFKLPEDESSDRLLIICHHLVVDGISWRILLSDLMKAYRDGARFIKTHSYRQWVQSLSLRVPEFQKEMNYWQQQCLPTDAHLSEDQTIPNVIADERKVISQLSTHETKMLLHSTPLAYNSNAEHIILTATLIALSEWLGNKHIRIDMEGHGRNGHADQLDLSNTLGWFTAIYPLRFNLTDDNDCVETLKSVKEKLKSVPQGGVGFGVLKYLSDDSSEKSKLAYKDKVSISFNYMGQVRSDQDDQFSIAREATGLGNDPRQTRSHTLAIGGIIENERLKLHCHYSDKIHTQEEIQSLIDNTIEKLHELIIHCSNNPYAGATPSDFPEYPKLSQLELDQVWQHAKMTPEKGRIQAVGQLSGAQQGMIYHSQLKTQDAIYVEQLSYRISGPLDKLKLKNAWQQVINNHDIFRVEFLGLDTSNPCQVIREKTNLTWFENDISKLNATEQAETLEKLIEQDRKQPFHFDNAPLMRLRLCIESDSSAILTWSYHHALMDGWSMPLVFKSLFVAYQESLTDSYSSKPSPSFRCYLNWLGKQDKSAAKIFWRNYLKGFSSPTPLVVNKDSLNSDQSGANEISRELSHSVYSQLQKLCKSYGVTLNSICQTAWAALLARYSSEEDVLFAITSSGRSGDIEGINEIVGPFINTLPTRIQISHEMSVEEMISQVHMQQADVNKFGYLSLTDIQSESEIPNGVNLFESIFAFENYPIDDTIKENNLPINFKPLEWKSQTNFPLTVIWAPGETLKVKVQFAQQHFDFATVNRLVEHYITIIEAISRQEHPLEINLLTQTEQQQMLAWNNTSQAYDTELCIHQLISKQAKKTPDAIALYFEKGHISYKKLEQKSAALAYTLQDQKLAQTDGLIAVCLPRGIDQVVACLGIMKAGSAYLPLDPKWPLERRQKLLIKGQATAVIATDEIAQELNTDLTVINPAEVRKFDSKMSLDTKVKPSDLAYVIFTSGSTGEPKGVMIEHRSAVNTFIDINSRFNISPDDRVLAISALTFDLSVYDLFGVLCCGAAAVLPNDDEATNSRSWARLIEQHKVTIWDSVPQLMSILLEEAEANNEINIASLRTIMMSGDWIPLDLPVRIKNILPNASVNSLGGATEGSIWSITYPIESHDLQWKSIPYGKPMANQQFYIMDDRDQPCPIGVPGHLYIGGMGVARGYWADPERTGLQFRPHPQTGEPVYWTGDLAKYGDDGNIEFLGRSDFQVKINGFRIELGEIETALNQVDGIIRSVVIAYDYSEDKRTLLAYVIARPDEFDEEQCIQHLQVCLPRYMVPSTIIRLDKIPLSSNGKVDRNALPKPAEDQLSKVFVAPVSETETTISETWKELLKCEKVGVNDNFFDLGGHSLLATQMVSRLARALNIEVPMELVFRLPTVKSLAQKIDELLTKNRIEGDLEEGEL